MRRFGPCRPQSGFSSTHFYTEIRGKDCHAWFAADLLCSACAPAVHGTLLFAFATWHVEAMECSLACSRCITLKHPMSCCGELCWIEADRLACWDNALVKSFGRVSQVLVCTRHMHFHIHAYLPDLMITVRLALNRAVKGLVLRSIQHKCIAGSFSSQAHTFQTCATLLAGLGPTLRCKVRQECRLPCRA